MTLSTQLSLPFDAAAARALSKRIAEEVYFAALDASVELAAEHGKHPAFAETRAARGELQFDAWGVVPEDVAHWDELRARVRAVGLRNSLLIAIAPTATIASIAGCYECIEPQVSNLFKRETLSGDFIQVNRYLVDMLKRLGLWSEHTRARLKLAEGSVQALVELPEDARRLFRTAWELPMRSLIDMADESAHMAFAFEVVEAVRREEPELFDDQLEAEVRAMMSEAIACETQFAEDLLSGGVAGLSVDDVRTYLEYCADQRLATLGFARQYGSKNPFGFLALQDVQEVTNFFERRVSAYQVGVEGEVAFDAAF